MENRIRRILRSRGLKVTGTRREVLKYLLESREHPSAVMIREHLEKKDMDIPLSTLYNILDVFVEKGIIIKVTEDENDMARYDARCDFHIHVYDSRNNTVSDIDDDEMSIKVRKLIEEIKKNADLPEGAKVLIEA